MIEPGMKQASGAGWRRLQRIGGQAALMAAAVFGIAVIDLAAGALRPGGGQTWLSPLQNNWLVILFKLHARFRDIQPDALYRLNLLDLSILALVCIAHLGLYAALRKTSKIWSAVALAQPLIGIFLFIFTKSAGRSTVMGAGLVISLVMLRSAIFGRVAAITGIIASVFLLVGDISVGIVLSPAIAALTGAGYLLLMAWFFLVGRRLVSSSPHAGTVSG
jgi:hypothetical protein